MTVGSDRAASAPNPPMQLTAFGAQDRGFCDVIPCRASAAADGQLVGRSDPIAFVSPVECYTNPIRRCSTSRMLYESDSLLPPIRWMGESDS
jgi:hypothetical protein